MGMKITDLGLFELMDRSSMILENFSEKVSEHPSTQGDEELKELAQEIDDKLMAFYQLAANRFWKSKG